tara:strand:- start:372 stop:920 length:549 start_codon:yes stop_codon:yes gene_type:complete
MPSAAISTYLKPPAAAAGGSWTYEGGEVTERDTTSTSNATMTTITGLSISADKHVAIFTRWKSDAGASSHRSGGTLQINGTNYSTALKDVGYDSSAAIAGGWKLEWLAPREDTYATGAFQIAGGGYGTGGGDYFANHGLPTLEESNDWDTEDISSIRIGGRVGSGSITLKLKGVYIYSIAVA